MTWAPAQFGDGAAGVHQRNAEREVDPARGCRLEARAPGEACGAAEDPRLNSHQGLSEDPRELRRIEHRIGGEVEGSPHITDEGESISLAHVERVDHLKTQVGDVGYERDES